MLDNFYCSEKFTYLTVDIERKKSHSCCSATPERIDINWLKQNPGQIFNTPLLQQERQLMLDNIPVPSCADNCWKPEANGLTSRRLQQNTTARTHTNIATNTPKDLHIVLGSTCNLTCSYCCKEYSSAWARDIDKNGPYLDQPRFTLTAQDKILANLSQADHLETANFKFLCDELSKLSGVEKIMITGGEPLLYNYFPDFINQLPTDVTIVFYTGLGVNTKRFKNQLSRIENKANIEVKVSAENCNKLYEFNRYGNSYSNFEINFNELIDQNFKIGFSSVISNLTIFGFADFWNKYNQYSINYSFCNDPDFLGVQVLNDITKDYIVEELDTSSIPFKNSLIKEIRKPCNDTQKQNFKIYINQFVKRRNLELAIFPASMLQWAVT